MSAEVESKDKDEKQEDICKKWQREIEAGKKFLRDWHKEGEKVLKRFLDDRKGEDAALAGMITRLNLFHSNITTMMSMLYGRIPKVEVARRFADADDDAARVAALMLTRILNTDIEVAGEDAASVFRNGLQDRLLPGLGTARVQYKCRIEPQPVADDMGQPVIGEDGKPVMEDQLVDEWCETVYTFWKDVLWSPCRTFSELRWKAYRSFLNKGEFKKRFPKVPLDKITFSSKGAMAKTKYEEGIDTALNPQVEVWEIWDKTNDCVYWWTDSYDKMLDHQEDPLELDGFFPEPPPMIANLTTTKLLPRSDYCLAQDLYREIDELETRISILTEACKCVGVYDKKNKGIERIFNEAIENDLIPVDDWAMFAEKGGLTGSIDWVPMEAVAKTIDILSQKQSDKITKLQQVTGMNDIMRGAASSPERTSATRDQLEANFGSIRIEALQNEFARWVSDIQGLRVEIIAKHYQEETIIQQSNIQATNDGQDQAIVQAAVQLIKDPKNSKWRVTVRPETLAIADYARLKEERMEYINGLAMFMQSMSPLLEIEPGSMPTLMKLLKWGLSGFRGSNEIEGVLDAEITRIEKTPKPDKPDPGAEKAKAEAAKLQMEMQQSQMEFQAKMQMEQQKHQAEIQKMQMELQGSREEREMERQQNEEKFQMEMAHLIAKHKLEMTKLQAELEAAEREQAAQFAFNTAERNHEAKVAVQSGDEKLRQDRERADIKGKGDADNG